MPELPDILVYVDALRARVLGQPLERIGIISPFLVRSVAPPIEEAEGRTVLDVRRVGKRLVLCLDDELFIVFHLMIAGRFRWLQREAKAPGKITLGVFDFSCGSLVLTEAGSKKRASLHLVRTEAALAAHDPGGLEVLAADAGAFREVLRRRNHTLKRALTDPRLFSGIGNAYSDEILHAARLSPIALTRKLSDTEIDELFIAARETLTAWIGAMRARFGDRFPGPGEITAFQPGFAVHGRFGQPCPVCAAPVQRIRYAENETNYCASCQTNGRVLADRSLSRLLKNDWPRSVEELERPG